MLARYGNGSVFPRSQFIFVSGDSLSILEIRYLSLKPRPSCKVLNSDNPTILSATTTKLQRNTFERRNQCTSGEADDWQCRQPLDVCGYIWRRISVSNHDCRYRRYPGPRYSRASRRTGSYWLSARAYINYRPLRCAIVPSLIEDHVNIDRMLPAFELSSRRVILLWIEKA